MPLPVIIPILSAIATMLGTAASVNQSLNPPKSKTSTPAPAAGAAAPAESIFAQGIPQLGSMVAGGGAGPRTDKAPPPANFEAPDLGPMLAASNLANLQGLGAQAKAPQANLGGGMPDITSLLAAAPEAIANMAPLLGLLTGQNQQRGSRQAVGAQGGGAGGQMVPGLSLPQHATITQILQALPRPRYG